MGVQTLYMNRKQLFDLIQDREGVECRDMIEDCLDGCIFMTFESILYHLNALLMSYNSVVKVRDVNLETIDWLWKVEIQD